ncbi:hypothetical protein DVH24_022445 [Malus domestica]|uniref:Uncharacterized protein n=1 Tax=Malus domestica TaxID=3750 RepID=A0A498KMA6_MALDO|nr:hypothetical protein DVH24_022445 [Malus domestica]
MNKGHGKDTGSGGQTILVQKTWKDTGSRGALRHASNIIKYTSSSMSELFHVLPKEIAIGGLLCFAAMAPPRRILMP